MPGPHTRCTARRSCGDCPHSLEPAPFRKRCSELSTEQPSSAAWQLEPAGLQRGSPRACNACTGPAAARPQCLGVLSAFCQLLSLPETAKRHFDELTSWVSFSLSAAHQTGELCYTPCRRYLFHFTSGKIRAWVCF